MLTLNPIKPLHEVLCCHRDPTGSLPTHSLLCHFQKKKKKKKNQGENGSGGGDVAEKGEAKNGKLQEIG